VAFSFTCVHWVDEEINKLKVVAEQNRGNQGMCGCALHGCHCCLACYAGPMLEVVLQAYNTSDIPDLKDHSHGMFSQMAKVLQESFAPWLPRVVPLAFASIR